MSVSIYGMIRYTYKEESEEVQVGMLDQELEDELSSPSNSRIQDRYIYIYMYIHDYIILYMYMIYIIYTHIILFTDLCFSQ